MAFLDNSGDIILDAVLTDAGRARMARGDGSFKVVKFALGDDEINYRLFDNNGDGFTQIRKTPVFEAFTNNIASLNSRLISIPRQDFLELPVLKINNLFYNNGNSNYANSGLSKGYVLAADLETENYLSSPTSFFNGVSTNMGVINGYSKTTGVTLRVDQGLDHKDTETTPLQTDLEETQYMIEMDNRIAFLLDKNAVQKQYSYVDDDYMASYYVFYNPQSTNFVSKNTYVATSGNQSTLQVLSGSKGTILEFKLGAASDVATSTYLFERLGTKIDVPNNLLKISTTVRVTGLTTGCSVDIPIAVLKKVTYY